MFQGFRFTQAGGWITPQHLLQDYAEIPKLWDTTGKTDGNDARQGWYDYDPEGWAFHTQGPNGLDFHEIEFVDNTTSQITDPFGLVRTETLQTIQGDHRQTQLQALKSAYGGYTPWTRGTSYDTRGFPDIVNDFDGTIIDHDYNPQGLEDYRIEVKDEAEKAISTPPGTRIFACPQRSSNRAVAGASFTPPTVCWMNKARFGGLSH